MNDLERADRIADRVLRNPKVAQIVADAHLFDSLRDNPGWRRLFEVVSAKREKWMKNVSARFMGPQSRWPKPDEIAYHKGFYEGAFFVLAHPEYAEENLERAARIAWAMMAEDTEPEEADE